jgi:release factor glutamine methyltransferase
VTIGHLIDEAAAALAEAGIESPRREARLLLGHVLGEDASMLAIRPDRPVPDDAAARFRALMVRRQAHEPFAYISGTRAFWSLDLDVSPATLIPRPDTETLVEAALAHVGHRGRRLEILDMGTGTGAILLALLSEMPVAEGLGIDVSPPALEIARRNAVRAGVAARAAFSISSWWSHVRGSFDLIVSNPPYIPSSDILTLDADVRSYEPHLALDGGPDGLSAYRAIAAGAAGHLAPGGALIVEVGHGQSADVAALFRWRGFTRIEVIPDLGGVQRVVSASF